MKPFYIVYRNKRMSVEESQCSSRNQKEIPQVRLQQLPETCFNVNTKAPFLWHGKKYKEAAPKCNIVLV